MSVHIEHFSFSDEQVCRLTGLTKRQLRYWDETGFFSPALSSPRSRVYSFRDLVGLRTIAKLRESVPLQELRKIGAWLKDEHKTPWASLRFYLDGRTVYFRDQQGAIVSTKPRGQTVCIEMREIVNETRALVRDQRTRSKSDVGKIVRRRRVVQNSPVLSGTRIPVQAVWNFRQAGYTEKQIQAEYPSLTISDIRGAIRYARQNAKKKHADGKRAI